jgi:ankyrin repeat protein
MLSFAITIACEQCPDVEIFQSLLVMNTDINSVDNYGSTSLFLSINSGYHFFVKELIAVGTNTNIANMFEITLLRIVAKNGDINIFSDLILHGNADVRVVDRNGKTILNRAAEGRNEKYYKN